MDEPFSLLELSLKLLELDLLIITVFGVFAVYIFGAKVIGFLLHWDPASSSLLRRLRNFSQRRQMLVEMKDDDYEQAEVTDHEDATADGEPAVPAVSNLIFKPFIDRRPLNVARLRDWIGREFLPKVNNRYDWFALWRLLRDHDLFASGMDKTSKFAAQMNEWFPADPPRCVPGEMNRYRRGLLGDTPHAKWDRNAFYRQLDDKQSMDGYERLDDLYNTLDASFNKDELKA